MGTDRWERYYRYENIHGFREQEPYYAYVLECFTPYVEETVDPQLPLKVALGGIHPSATKPSEFVALCRQLFPTRRLLPYVIDQNPRVFEVIDEDGFFPAVEQLENLPPHSFDHLSLLITDFTLDFMTDRQLTKLDQTLPSRLQPNGIFVATISDVSFPLLRGLQDMREFGLHLHYRNPQRVRRLLGNLKLIFAASTGNHNHLLVFTRKGTGAPEFTGPAIGLFDDEGSFQEWLRQRRATSGS